MPDHVNLDYFRDLGPIQRMIVAKPEQENKFYKAHANVMSNLRDPIKEQEIYMLSLSGLVPMSKISALTTLLKQLDESRTSDAQNESLTNGDTRKNLLRIVDWSVQSDWEQFESSDEDESMMQMFSNGNEDVLNMDPDMVDTSGEKDGQEEDEY